MRARLSFPLVRFTVAAAGMLFLAVVADSAPLYHANSLHYRTQIFSPGVAVGDFDGDSKVDYALGITSIGPSLQTARGHGDGSFDPVQNLMGGAIGAPAVADLDGDGLSDVAMSNSSGISLRYGVAGLGLGGDVALPSPSAPYILRVDIADLNGDTRPDLVTAINNYGGVVARLATSPTTYGPEVVSPFSTGFRIIRLLARDLDEDGAPDLVVLATNDTSVTFVGWMKGAGDGTFGAPTQIASALMESSFFLADLNGDLHLDLGRPEVWNAGDGHGNFAAATPYAPGDLYVLNAGDVTGDGFADLVASGLANESLTNGGTLEVYRGDGAGGFTRTWAVPILEFDSIAFADFDGDGIDDVIANNGVAANATIHLSNGDGTFGSEAHYTTGNLPSSVALAEVTGDSYLDAVVTSRLDNTVSVHPGEGDGTFGARTTYAIGAGPAGVAVGDMNGDGLADVVTADAGSNAVSVLLGQTGGGLSSAASYAAGTLPVAIALADMNRDGKLDAVVVNQTVNTCSVLYGDGAGGLVPGPSVPTSTFPVAVAAADIDGDQWPDVAVMTGAQTKSAFADVIRNNGAGGLLPKTTYAGISSGGRAIAIAEVTGDSYPDVVAVSRGFVVVLEDQGGGVLSPLPGFRVGQGRAVVVADGNRDGKPDLFIPGDWSNCVWFAAGNGDGTFAEAEGYGADRSPWSIALGDLDDDGFFDIVVADSDTNRISVLRSIPTAPVTVPSPPMSAGLALAGARPNPSQGVFQVSFTLPDASAARLELYDVAGRRLLTREVGGLGPGAHALPLSETRSLASGVYWIRLVHAQQALVSRAALLH